MKKDDIINTYIKPCEKVYITNEHRGECYCKEKCIAFYICGVRVKYCMQCKAAYIRGDQHYNKISFEDIELIDESDKEIINKLKEEQKRKKKLREKCRNVQKVHYVHQVKREPIEVGSSLEISYCKITNPISPKIKRKRSFFS